MKTLQHRFVEFIPEQVEEGILYISINYCTTIHKCICGCGNEVVTPLSPTDWELTFNGKTVSLSPSIGNWNFDCQSHYWITNSQIHYSDKWSSEKIATARQIDFEQKKEFYNKDYIKSSTHTSSYSAHKKTSLRCVLKNFLNKLFKSSKSQ